MRLSVTILAGFLAGALATPLHFLSRPSDNSTSLKKPITSHNQMRPLGAWRLNKTSGWQANKRSLEDRDLNQRAVTDLNVTRKVILKPTPRVPSLLKRDTEDDVEAAEGNNTAAAEKKSGLPKIGVVLLELIMNFTRPEQNATSNGVELKVDITKTGDDVKEGESAKEAKGKVKEIPADDEDDDEDDSKVKNNDKDTDDEDDDDEEDDKRVKDDDKDKDGDDDDEDEDYKYKKGDDDDEEEDDYDDYKHKDEAEDLKKEAEELKKKGDAAEKGDDEDTDDAREAKAQTKATKYEAQQNKRTSGQSKEQTKAETKEIKEEIKGGEESSKPLLHKRSANETDEHHQHRHEVNREEFMRFVESVDKAEEPRNRINMLI